MLSVIIIAKNEELVIRRCLDSIRWVDEIIVLDSGSEDKTVSIAKEYTPHVYSTDWQGYGMQKQRALALTTEDWVLNLDADEYVDDSLKHAILTAIATNQADAYRIPIRMNFYNKPLNYSSSPTRHIRLFKREGASYKASDIVHEKVILPLASRIKKIKNPIMHHSFQDLSHALHKMNRYSSYSAKLRIANSKPPSFMSIFLGTGWMFLRTYFLQWGFLDGKAGFILAILSAQGTFYRGIKQHYPDKKIDGLSDINHSENS